LGGCWGVGGQIASLGFEEKTAHRDQEDEGQRLEGKGVNKTMEAKTSFRGSEKRLV